MSATETVTTETQFDPIVLTAQAVQKVKSAMQREGAGPEKALRIGVVAPFSGAFADYPWVEAIFMSGLFALVGLGAVLFPFMLNGFSSQITYAGEQFNIVGDEGKVRRTGDEILSPFWRRADAAESVEVVQLAAYHTQGNTATIKWHYASSFTTTNIFFPMQKQRSLPHFTSSVTSGSAPQIPRKLSSVIEDYPS